MLPKVVMSSTTFMNNHTVSIYMLSIFFKSVKSYVIRYCRHIIIFRENHIEDKGISTYPSPPPFWKRFVDDIITALPKVSVQPFLNHLNSID